MTKNRYSKSLKVLSDRAFNDLAVGVAKQMDSKPEEDLDKICEHIHMFYKTYTRTVAPFCTYNPKFVTRLRDGLIATFRSRLEAYLLPLRPIVATGRKHRLIKDSHFLVAQMLFDEKFGQKPNV